MTAKNHNPRECWCGINHRLKRQIETARVEYESADGISSASAITAYKLGKIDGLQLALAIAQESER